MRVRLFANPNPPGTATRFCQYDTRKVQVYWDDGTASRVHAEKLDVLLSDGRWVSLRRALRHYWVITDYFGRTFREPVNDQEMDQGFY